MKRPSSFLAALALSSTWIAAAPGGAQTAGGPAAPRATVPVGGAPIEGAPAYAEIADLVIASPVIVDAVIRSTTRIKGAEAAQVPAGRIRFYVEADVTALIRGPGAIPPRIGYLLDVPPDARGRPPKLKKARVLLFARPVAGRAGQLQLVGGEGQRAWSAGLDARARGIARELVAADAPPVVTGVGNVFTVPGSLPGESETQIFLTTADARPVSLTVLRRPGETPRWAVALSEIVDDSAAPPPRDTLLWYRLACALPPALPERSAASLDPANAQQSRADYAFVIDQLGPCRNDGTGRANPGL